jgi:hypothetical protein
VKTIYKDRKKKTLHGYLIASNHWTTWNIVFCMTFQHLFYVTTTPYVHLICQLWRGALKWTLIQLGSWEDADQCSKAGLGTETAFPASSLMLQVRDTHSQPKPTQCAPDLNGNISFPLILTEDLSEQQSGDYMRGSPYHTNSYSLLEFTVVWHVW